MAQMSIISYHNDINLPYQMHLLQCIYLKSNHSIFVIGDRHNKNKIFEKNLKNNEWNEIETYPNNIECAGHCVIKIDDNNIYSMGGVDKNKNDHFLLFNNKFKYELLTNKNQKIRIGGGAKCIEMINPINK